MLMLPAPTTVVQSESRAEVLGRLAHEDASELARLERTYPLLIETRVATVPKSEKALLTAVAAFLEGLGLEPGWQSGALVMDFLGRFCELRLYVQDEADDPDLELRAISAAWDGLFDGMDSASRLDRRLAELGKESA